MSRQYSKVSSTLFNSKKFRRLNRFEKLVYIYLLISPNGNSGGCFEQPSHVAIAEIDCTPEEYADAMDSLSRELIGYDKESETVLIRNWFEFNPLTNGKHAIGAVDQIAKSAKGELKRQALQELRGFVELMGGEKDGKQCSSALSKIDRLLEAYAVSIPTKTIPVEDQKKTIPEEKKEAREIEISGEDASACDVTAADAPSDGGEGARGKRTIRMRGTDDWRSGGTDAFKALTAETDSTTCH